MKNNKILRVITVSTILFFTSCSNKTNEICDCLKKAANTYMVKGQKANEHDLMVMCNQFEGALKNANVDDKRIVQDCLDTVKNHIDDKVLFTDVDKISLPQLPCGLQLQEEILRVSDEKIMKINKAKSMEYFLKNRILNCKMIVFNVQTKFSNHDMKYNNMPRIYEVENGNVFVNGFLYNDSKIENTLITLMIPEKDKDKIQGYNYDASSNKDLFNQIIEFSGTLNTILESVVGEMRPSFNVSSYQLLNPIEGKDRIENNEKATFNYSSTQASAMENGKANSLNKEESNASYSDVIGAWKGQFGKDELTLNIETFDYTHVTGYSSVKNNNRDIEGTFKTTSAGYSMVLQEPGDDEWDGIFSIEYITSSKKLVGNWKANNGNSNKSFTLTKQD